MNLIGKVLANRYEIIEEVGSGGMAIVYKAKCQLLNRFVAVKVLRSDLQNDAEFVRRFNVEAQAAASLAHPNIVSIYDVGNEDGLHYIVMEYIEGETLKDYIDKKRILPWREAVSYAIQIGRGLEQAHKNSIVHRDIKPHNIIMTADGVLKVTDFGIARANVQSTMTCEDSAIGSVHYISPEQARGGYTDARSDIYSLGIVLYEMLTGNVPFDNESPVTIAIKHIQEAPVPPREHNISIPLAVEQIVLKAISKELSMRYKTVSDFIKELQDVLDDPSRIINEIVDSEEKKADNEQTKIMPVIKETETKESDQLSKNNEGEDSDMAAKGKTKSSATLDKKKEKKVITIAILAAIVVILLTGLAFSSLLGLGELFSKSQNVEIPDLSGMLYEEAVEKYKTAGFSIVRDKTIKDEKVGEGIILSQEPTAGAKKKTGDAIVIKVNVSAGPEKIIMKDYKSDDKRTATAALENLGLKVEVLEEFSDTFPIGTVIKHSPTSNIPVEKGEVVTLFVSKGPDPDNKEEEQKEEEPKKTDTPKKKSTTLTISGPNDKNSALVEIKVKGKTVYSKNLTKGEFDEVILEGTSNTVTAEVYYDGTLKQTKTFELN